MKTPMLSGDGKEGAEDVARKLGTDHQQVHHPMRLLLYSGHG